MFNFGSGQGNPNMKLGMNSTQNKYAAFGGAGKMPGAMPTQKQMGTGMDSSKAMMLMSMLGGQGQDKGSPTVMHGGGIDYQAPTLAPYEAQRDPQQVAYQQAVMQALMSRGGQNGVI